MNFYKYLLCYLFIIIGLIIIYNPKIIIDNINKNYNTKYLLQAWGLYSIIVGCIILFPEKYKYILYVGFICSIYWHLYIIKNKEYTFHHLLSIFINIIAIIITKLIN